MAERKAETTAVLRRLSADGVPLWRVLPGTRDTEKIVVFLDGTRMLFSVRYSAADLRFMAEAASWPPVRVAYVQPCFGHRWFRLWLAAAGRADPVEMLASVMPVPPGSPESSR
jgi:hypothetical protein